jgi:hypothetical protein
MTLREIYEHYKIMPGLQQHQLRVAAVGKLICDNFDLPINTRDVVLAGLFHDMGNVIKADLTIFPDLLRPKGQLYWQEVKDTYIQKYGTDEHEATLQIVRELGLPDTVYSYIDGIGFSTMHITRDSRSFEQKICEYADLRVGPHGVLSLEERIEEGRRRYAGRTSEMPAHEDRFASLKDAAMEIERQIFSHTALEPSSITDLSIATIVSELWDYPIS